MTREWMDAVLAAWEKNRGEGALAVQRTGLPMPARDAWEAETQGALKEGSGRMPSAGRFAVEGRNAFFVIRAIDEAGGARVHLYDAAGHVIASGTSSAAGMVWAD